MAKTVSYGIGQYRYNKYYNYITNISYSGKATSTTSDSTIPASGQLQSWEWSYVKSSYEDPVVKLPLASDASGTPLIQYGNTYYMRVTIPQNNQYQTILDLKLCAGDTNTNSCDTSKFQHIKRLIIPPTPANDDNYSDVLLYEVPDDNTKTIKAQVLDKNHDQLKKGSSFSTFVAGEAYRTGSSGNYSYVYATSSNHAEPITKSTFYTLLQGWNVSSSDSQATVTFDFVFSPKYNLTGGYSYLVFETDRTDSYHQSIQYIDEGDGKTYYGTRLLKEDIQLELYSVNNLLERGSDGLSQIQSGTDTLTHIGIWGHPEQLLAINGEEIKIGQSGFYELTDFTIRTLGVVVRDPNEDRFTIDYEYRIVGG